MSASTCQRPRVGSRTDVLSRSYQLIERFLHWWEFSLMCLGLGFARGFQFLVAVQDRLSKSL